MHTLKWCAIQEAINLLDEQPTIDANTDGYHSFDELYKHRMILFSIICRGNNNAWKSWKHSDGTMYDDYFIVGIGDENGYFSYHYHKDYWNMFDVQERDFAPKWDENNEVKIDELTNFLEKGSDGKERYEHI